MFFHSVGNVIIPIDELIFFRGVAQPPTRYVYESFINCTLICGAHGRLESYMYIHKMC